MFSTAEIISKVRELEIVSKKITTQLSSGEYRSTFRGRGMRFREVRDYYPGDDVRFIDWNVSARYAHPFTKVFEEERELTVMLLIDISGSSMFGTQQKRKKDLITEIGSVIAFNAIKNKDKVGVIFFTDKVEKYIPPKEGRKHVLYIVRELLTTLPESNKTNIQNALQFFNRNSHQKGIVFLISDFLDQQYEHMLRLSAHRHDLIGIHVYDKLDSNLPDIGMIKVRDLERNTTRWIDTSNVFLRHQYHQNFIDRINQSKTIFKQAGADLLQIRNDEDYVRYLQQFFKQRKRIR